MKKKLQRGGFLMAAFFTMCMIKMCFESGAALGKTLAVGAFCGLLSIWCFYLSTTIQKHKTISGL